MKIKKYNYEILILALQIAVVAALIASVFLIKFINIDWFNTIKGFYIGNFGADTKVEEVLEDDYTLDDATVTVMSKAPSFANKSTGKILLNPLKKINVTSAYGWRNNPIDGKREFHKGVDLSGNIGDEIFSVAGGEVLLSQFSSTYGNYLIIEHSNGIKTLYAHCETLHKAVGEKVVAGEVIALLGSTGRSTAPHLHYEVILNGQNINPEWLISQ